MKCTPSCRKFHKSNRSSWIWIGHGSLIKLLTCVLGVLDQNNIWYKLVTKINLRFVDKTRLNWIFVWSYDEDMLWGGARGGASHTILLWDHTGMGQHQRVVLFWKIKPVLFCHILTFWLIKFNLKIKVVILVMLTLLNIIWYLYCDIS